MRINKDIFDKFPIQTKKGYTWEGAYAEATTNHRMLSGQIFEELPEPAIDDTAYLKKTYDTRRGARKALVKAVKRYMKKKYKEYLDQ